MTADLYEANEEQNPLQAWCDSMYADIGPCCAGCDWWRSAYFQAGECTRSAPVSGNSERWYLVMGEVTFFDLPETSGHIMTPPQYRCGEFKDTFDWQTLDTRYLKRIGFPGKISPTPHPGDPT